ncbi:MAG: anaerobic ribonucleoside-triphosphate reductase [Bacteroidales bacterium]
MKVIKRDGREVSFSDQKILTAIKLANESVDEGFQLSEKKIKSAFEFIKKELEGKESITVEDIQDLVEKSLMNKNFYEVAKSFICYRKERTKIRHNKSEIIKTIEEKLQASNIENQNANVDEASFGGRKGEADSALMKQIALDSYLSPMAKKNHENNEIYIHDLDNYVIGCHNCLSIPFDSLLAKGFNTRQTDVRPANSIGTAFQLTAVIFQLQSLQQFGGCSATHLDWTMVPYVRKSYYKHYKDGLKFVEHLDDSEIGAVLNRLLCKETLDKNDNFEFLEITDLSISDKKYEEYPNVKNYADELTKRECEQSAEGMYHNLNTLQSRSGNQLPFTSINYGTCTLPEGRLIIKALLEASIKGVGSLYKTAIFPCGIFQYKKGVNDVEGTPNYDLKLLAIESTTKRLYPNYANCDWSNQKSWVLDDRNEKQEVLTVMKKEKDLYEKLIQRFNDNPSLLGQLGLRLDSNDLVPDYDNETPLEVFSTMGCRTANGSDINFSKENFSAHLHSIIRTGNLEEGQLVSKAQKDGRGNICPVTIILPTLAMKATKKSEETPEEVVEVFINILDRKIFEAVTILIERFTWITAQTHKSAKFMWENHTMSGYKKDEGIKSAIEHGTLAIGQIGLAETLRILIGEDHCTEKGMELAKRIEKLFSDRCKEYKEIHKLNFGVYYTPAENLCFTSMKNFKKEYGEIKNVSDRDYFTNSIHIPVWVKIDPLEKIKKESELTGYSSAGCITYVELDGSVLNNQKAVEQIVDFAMEKDLPYFAINTPNDSCNECGYTSEIDDACPKCGSMDISKLRRVTGYLTGNYTTAFNKGKQQEVIDRVKHNGEKT